jgi:hypothetical protein
MFELLFCRQTNCYLKTSKECWSKLFTTCQLPDKSSYFQQHSQLQLKNSGYDLRVICLVKILMYCICQERLIQIFLKPKVRIPCIIFSLHFTMELILQKLDKILKDVNKWIKWYFYNLRCVPYHWHNQTFLLKISSCCSIFNNIFNRKNT